MAIEKDKIKDLFSSKLGNFESDVPASVWGGLDQLLSSQPSPTGDATSSSTSSTTSTVTAGKTSLLKTLTITLGMAAAVATGVLLLTPDKEPSIQSEPKVVVAEKMEEEVKEILEEKVLAITSVPIRRKPELKESLSEKEEQVTIADENTVSQEEATVVTKVEENAIVKEETLIADNILAELPQFFTKDISFGLTTDMGLFANNMTQQGGEVLFSRADRGRALRDELTRENSEFKLEHRQPISFGLSIGKKITPQLSVETGLIYTYLSSKITSSSIYNIEENQYFDYLGIPLSLNYTLYELGKTQFYLSLGGMVQKDVKGRYESKMNFSGNSVNEYLSLEPSYMKKEIKQSNPQFSVRTRLGIAYPLYKKLYLYGTVGGAYYFDAGNEYRTIYSDKKTQLDLNLGIKFDF